MDYFNTSSQVDIIIPIYNAYEELCVCLESLYKYTDLKKNRLILINDNSPDERIKTYLDEQLSDEKNIIVIHNSQNKGFSGNINIGMSQSEVNDVILLNSDTVLTKNWVEKLRACAYRDAGIGTVTPLSNNATLCSVPNSFDENTLPEGMPIDTAAEIVEKAGLKRYPRISVGMGFCMYVKREAINCVGNFDAATFGKGYGEENDFCNRCEQLGFYNAMCDDTYIYHSGTKSFISKEKEKLIRDHERILFERYPQLMQYNEKYVATRPNEDIADNLKIYFDLYNDKKNVLLWAYADFRATEEDHIGGTQMHVCHLTEKLKDRYNVFVAARSYDYLVVTAYIDEKTYSFKFYIGDMHTFQPISDPVLAKTIRNILIAFRINLVHVHHTKKTSFDIFYEAEKLDIPVIFTAHDFYCLCPTINMLDEGNEICMDKECYDCKSCLNSKLNITADDNYIKMWRNHYNDVLEKCRLIITPSDNTKEYICKYYPNLKNKIQTIEHGIDWTPIEKSLSKYNITVTDDLRLECGLHYENGNQMIRLEGVVKSCSGKKYDEVFLKLSTDKNEELLPIILDENDYFTTYVPKYKFAESSVSLSVCALDGKTKILSQQTIPINAKIGNAELNQKLKVAFIGGLNAIKGAKTAYQIIKDGNNNIEFYTFGMIGDSDLAGLRKDNYFPMGRYNAKYICELLKFYHIDVVCILSIWPETFSYTVSEASLAGIPLIVTDTGALADRVRRDNLGEVVSIKNAKEETLNILNRWAKNRDEYNSAKEIVEKFKHLTENQMADKYDKIYQDNLKETDSYFIGKFDTEYVYSGYKTVTYNNSDTDYAKKYKEVEYVFNTFTWKITNKLLSMNFPFKQKIYNWLVQRQK